MKYKEDSRRKQQWRYVIIDEKNPEEYISLGDLRGLSERKS